MQDQKITTYLLLAVPTDVMDEADICEGTLLQFSASDGKIIIEPVTEITDFVCDGVCEDCPMRELDCNINFLASVSLSRFGHCKGAIPTACLNF